MKEVEAATLSHRASGAVDLVVELFYRRTRDVRFTPTRVQTARWSNGSTKN